MKQEIIGRTKVESCNGIVRSLKCGHSMPELRGSKAKDAKWAKCVVCRESGKLLMNNPEFKGFAPHSPDPVD